MYKKMFSLSFAIMFCFLVTNLQAQNKKDMSKTKMSMKNVYGAMLSGKNVVPPVKTKAYGKASFTFSKDGKSLHYELMVYHVDSVMMAHIHHAPAGKNGPIAVWLYKGKVTKKVNGLLSQGTITNKTVNLDSLRTWMNNGDAYVLVHTKKYPGGEIRGIIKHSK